MIARALKRTVLYAVLAAFLVVAAYPLFWMTASSLKTEREIDIGANKWGLPESFHWQNYREVLVNAQFGRYVLNSVIVTASAVAITLAAAALAGFAFAKLRFRGRRYLFLLFLAGMMVPVHIVLIPVLRIFSLIGLTDTHAGLVMCYVSFSLPISVFILRGFFEGVPRELEEAARIDGCTPFGVFRHVCLPLARPALAVVAIFNFVTLWNEFVFALTLLNSKELRTIPLGLWRFSTEYGSTDLALTCAALVVSSLPMLLVYFVAQKHIIRGLTAGALKG